MYDLVFDNPRAVTQFLYANGATFADVKKFVELYDKRYEAVRVLRKETTW